MKVKLDTYQMIDREDAHEYLKNKFQFPDYYGRNLDALYDLLTEMDETEVVIVHRDEACAYCKRILQVFMAASRINAGLVLRIVE